jgi:hypothetical protein
MESTNQRIVVQVDLGIKQDLISKTAQTNKARDLTQVQSTEFNSPYHQKQTKQQKCPGKEVKNMDHIIKSINSLCT